MSRNWSYLKGLKQLILSTIVGTALAGCLGGGGGGASGSSTTPAATVVHSQFVDGPVAGLCYSSSPSAASGVTTATGSFNYSAGDTVTFWIDGSGNNCLGTGASSTAATSILLGIKNPTGAASFVLTFDQGQQTADILTSLNVGSSISNMNLAGIVVPGNIVTQLNTYISGAGTLPTSAAGSIDAFFNSVQLSVLSFGTNVAPTFATPIASSVSTTVSLLENAVNAAINQTTANLATIVTTAPAVNFTISTPLLRFAQSSNVYTLPLSSSTIYASIGANFMYFDGNNGVQRIEAQPYNSAFNSSIYQMSGTYTTPASNAFSFTLNKTNVNNSQPFTQVNNPTVTYDDGSEILSHGTFTKTYTGTSSVSPNQTFVSGNFTSTGRILTPISPTILSGHTLGLANGCTLTFTAIGGGTTVTQNKTCAGSATIYPPVTISSVANIPGLIQMTEPSTGYTSFRGLIGPLSAGSNSRFVTIQVNPGTGSLYSGTPWTFNPFITSFQ